MCQQLSEVRSEMTKMPHTENISWDWYLTMVLLPLCEIAEHQLFRGGGAMRLASAPCTPRSMSDREGSR